MRKPPFEFKYKLITLKQIISFLAFIRYTYCYSEIIIPFRHKLSIGFLRFIVNKILITVSNQTIIVALKESSGKNIDIFTSPDERHHSQQCRALSCTSFDRCMSFTADRSTATTDQLITSLKMVATNLSRHRRLLCSPSVWSNLN